MNEPVNKLCQVIDEFDGRDSNLAAIDELLADVNLQYQMRRYELIGEVMRHELPEKIDTEFSRSVMAQINQIDSTHQQSRPSGISFWKRAYFKPFAGIAVAASVAVVTVTLWQSAAVNQLSDQSGEQFISLSQKKIDKLASQQVVKNLVPVSSQLSNGTRWKVENNTPALQQKLNAYLVNHTEYSNSLQGLIPQARVAGFDSTQ